MDLIREINDKYVALEAEIDKKLEKVQVEEQKLNQKKEKLVEKSASSQQTTVLSYEEALQRNANTLKALEIAKARLRSRTTFSPVESLLQNALKNYKAELLGMQLPKVEQKKSKDRGKARTSKDNARKQSAVVEELAEEVDENEEDEDALIEEECTEDDDDDDVDEDEGPWYDLVIANAQENTANRRQH